MHPPPLAPRGDDARPAEIRQVTRDFWLADSEDLHKVADANFLVGDEVEKTKPGAIGQDAKEKIERERFFLPAHASYYIWLYRYDQRGLLLTHTHKRIYIQVGQEDPWQRNQ